MRVSAATLSRLARLEEFRDSRPVDDGRGDRAPWDWFALTCPCAKPAGECQVHPRARPAQRPPEGDWRTWLYMSGRGSGKTRSGACWIHDRVQSGKARNILLIAGTSADIRDTLIEGPAGILAVAPPWNQPRWEPSKRRVTWPNGARAICISGEEPERARGLNVDTLWADELPSWAFPRQTWDLSMLALRQGTDPRAFISTTPRRVDVLIRILSEPTTVVTRESTLANRLHLAPEFVDQILALYSGTRFAEQEIEGRLIDQPEGAWFARFDPAKHVRPDVDFVLGRPVEIAVDAGTSRTTAAVIYQTERIDKYRLRFHIIGDYLSVGGDRYSAQNAEAIRDTFATLCPSATLHTLWIDPASSARTSIGPSALAEYQRVFGERFVHQAPGGPVVDGLDTIEGLLDRGDLVISSRCIGLIDGLRNYARQSRGGEFLDVPALNQSPYEDSCDALRYGIRGTWPEGRKPPLNLPRLHASQVF